MNLDHPVVRQAWSVVSNREMAWQQAQEWELTVLAMEALETLQPSHSTAETVLRNAAGLLQSITVNYGASDWTVQQSHLIYQHAERVFGKGQLKFNKPMVQLGGNDGLHASRFHGMRLKFVHPEGL